MPFTTEEFLNVFKTYNETVFPMQVVFVFAAIVILYLIIKKTSKSSKIISLILSAIWVWTGLVYHILFFTAINKAAYVFGILFITQGVIIFFYGYVREKLKFSTGNPYFNYTRWFFIIYSLIIYPVIGFYSGHAYPYSPTFGLPCPLTIFTFGVLLFSENKFSLAVIFIPFLWSLLGFSAAWNFSITEDYGLIAAGVISMICFFIRRRSDSLGTVKAAF